MRGSLLFCFFQFTLFSQVLGQNQTTSAKKDSLFQDLDSIVVIGKKDQAYKALVSSKLQSGREDQAINILDDIPGISKIHETGYPLVLRGMHGNRVRIERNGILKTGFVDQGYLLNDINTENIEEVNLIGGAAKVLYGSGALGGVLEFKEYDASHKTTNSIYSKYATVNDAYNLGLVVGHNSSNSGIRFSGKKAEAGDFRYPNGKFAGNSAYSQNNLRLSGALKSKDDKFKATWNHEYNNGILGRPQGFQNNPFELRKYKNNLTYQTDLHINWDLKSNTSINQQLWALFSDTDQTRLNFNGDFSSINSHELRSYLKESFGYRAKLDLQPSEKWSSQFGADFISSSLEESINFNDYVNPSFSSQSDSERIERMLGVFSMATLQVRKISVLVSVRGDVARIGNENELLNFQALTGGIELGWFTEKVKQNVSLTRLFRYPSQQESIGVLVGGRGIFYGNPDIKPEFSHQLEWSLNGTQKKWQYSLHSWFALFDNRITEVYLGNNEFTYQNIERARTYGAEAMISKNWGQVFNSDRLISTLSASFIRGDNLGENGWLSPGEPLIGIPPLKVSGKAKYFKNFTSKISGSLSLDIDRFSALNRLPEGQIRQTWAVQETESYWLLGIALESELPIKTDKLIIGISVENLTNKEYYPFGARIMGMGRNFTFYTRFNF